MSTVRRFVPLAALAVALALSASAQPFGGPQPEAVRQGQQMIREGKLDDALALYRKELQGTPDSPQLNSATGVLLDLMGRGAEGRKYFQKAIDTAATPRARADAQRAMAMSYGFDGDCQNAVKYERRVMDYWATQTAADPHNAWYQQGEMANEGARVCIDSGDLDTAAKWYQTGYDAGMKEPDIPAGRKFLWTFRLEHAKARIAARRGNKSEAEKHVPAARAAIEGMATADPGLANQQKSFLPYLTGYVAFYSGDYKTALEDFQKANPDPFILCMIGQAYEKLGERDQAIEAYRKAAATTAHNPPAAYARPFARRKLA